MRAPTLTTLTVLATACGGTSFSGHTKSPTTAQTKPGNEEAGATAPKTVTEAFSLAGQPPSANYLIVRDNSISMDDDVANFRNALLSIPESRFPPNSLVGVMTTMTSEYGNYGKTHPGIRKYQGIESEPGFLALVTGKAIADFLASPQVDATKKSAYAIKGCDTGWFRPGAVEPATGKKCLDAALQNPQHGVDCEAGLNAVEQFLRKTKAAGNSLFQKGAFAHVILTSDEMHPGCTNAELIQKIPSYAQLRALAMDNSDIVGFRLHGIGKDPVAGPIKPGDELKAGTYATSARRRVDDAGGIYLNMDATDYTAVIERMVGSGRYEKALFSLKEMPTKVVSVKVDGTPTTKYRITAEGSLEILEVNLDADHQIEISYEVR